MSLTFREADHTYWIGERRIFGVSEVLSLVQDFSDIPPAVLARKQAIGKAAHLACQFIDEGDEVDPDSLDDVVRPYVDAWRLFLRDKRPTFDLIEEPLHDEALGYAGTPDRGAMMDGERWLIDIKTVVKVSPATGLQTAAYRRLYAAKMGVPEHPIRRAAVQLRKDGTYRFHPFTSPADWTTFQSLLNVKNWQAANRC